MRTSYSNSKFRALLRHIFNLKQMNMSDAMSTTWGLVGIVVAEDSTVLTLTL